MESPLQKMLPSDLYKDVMELGGDFSEESIKKTSGGEIPSWKGFRLMPPFTPELAKYAYDNWSLKDEEVLLASYPKTGTNWMMAILRRLLYSDEEINLMKQLPLTMGILESGSVKKFNIIDRLPIKRRMMGTHLPAELINLERWKKENAKVVYVMRNPKDQLVSFYHFAKKLVSKNPAIGRFINDGWEAYLDNALNGVLPSGTLPGEWYPHHLLSWYKHKDDKNFYFIYYEDLKKDFKKELRQLAKFLGVDITEEKVSEIEEKCSFGNMKQEISSYSNDMKMFQTVNLRKGEVGDWKNYFTVAQSERVDAKIKDCLGSTDVTFTYCL